MTNVVTTPGDQEFVVAGVEAMASAMRGAIAQNGRVVLGLSGGSTPKPIYEALGNAQIDWSKVWIFLVDDRYIRPDDPKSNQFLLRSTLLKNAPIPESQILFPDTSLPLPECADLYDRQVTDLLKKGPVDIVTLGLGEDGHIASLFPPLPDEAFGPKNVIHTTTDRFDVRERISVTMPVLTVAKSSVFFLKGAEKKRVWEQMTTSKDGPNRWPAKMLRNATVIAQW